MRTIAALVLVLGAGALRFQEPSGLRCKLAVSIDTAFVDRWDHTDLPQMSVVGSQWVFRDQHFGVYPLFSGYALDEHGRVHVTLDLRIARPDGQTYFEEKGVEALDQAGGDGTNMLLPPAIRFVSFDPPDPLGSYSVHLDAHDLVSGKSVVADAAIKLVEYKEGAGFASGADLNAWFGDYLASPEPERLIPALRDFAHGGWAKEHESARGSLRDLFEANQWAFPLVLASFAKQDAPLRELILWLLARSSYESDAFVKKLKKPDRAVWDKVSAETDPLTAPIASRDDLNELWGLYVPRRSLAPLRRLCLALAPEETGVVADVTVHDEKSGIDVPLAMVIQRVSPKSLARYIAWDPIARAYCEDMTRDPELPAGVQKALEALLAGQPDSAK